MNPPRIKHFSEHELDCLASGLSPMAAARSAHLEACAHCQARLNALQAQLEPIRQMPRFHQGAQVAAAAARARPRRLWIALPLAAAAAAAFLVLRPRPPEPTERLKGAAAIGLVGPQGNPVQSPLRVGDSVWLAVDPQGHGQGLIFAVDDQRVSQVWPATGTQSAPVSGGPLQPPFRVTPGPVILLAFFGDEPLSATDARAAAEAALARCPRPVAPACLGAITLPGVGARAQAQYVPGWE